MSFILDALRKAERDRNLGQAPNLQDVALASDEARRSTQARPPAPRLLVLAGLVLLVCLGLYLVFKPEREAARQRAPLPPGKITATVRGPAPAAASLEPQQAAPAQEEPAPAIDESASLASFDDLTGANPPPVIAPEPPAAEPEPTPRPDFVVRPEQPRATNFTPETPIPSASAMPEASAPDRQPPSDVAPQPAQAPVASASNATSLESMPQSYQAAFPSFSVDVHVWDSNPQKRFVLVSGRRYREGDTLAAGPRLVEIAQQGLVVDYNGERVLFSIAQ